MEIKDTITTESNFDKLEEIAKHNNPSYNRLKLCEELTELQERLLKFELKRPDKKPKKVDIAEEIGDVIIRVGMLLSTDEELSDLVEKRIAEKSELLIGYFEAKKYGNGI